MICDVATGRSKVLSFDRMHIYVAGIRLVCHF